MSKKRRNRNSRDAPKQVRSQSGVMLCDPKAWETLCSNTYRPLTSCPEVQRCISVYADLIASMTIQQMENTPDGDVRIRDGLSRKLDIEPHRHMVHQTWMSNLVRVMMTEGNQITLPHYDGDMLSDLEPIAPSKVSIVAEGRMSYHVMIEGVRYEPDEVLHFVENPDPEAPYKGQGFKVALQDVVDSLRQTNATKQALMKSPQPTLIVKVDGYDEEMRTPEGRTKLAQKYLYAERNGEPWILQADTFDIKEVKPMTLTDLAIDKTIELDKKAVAALIGVPSFLIGVGPFREEEFRWFVATQVMPRARVVQQVLTKGILISPTRYFRLNNWSLMNYDITKINSVCSAMVDKAAMRRNEWRDKIGLPPDPEMDDMLILENYLRGNKLQQNNMPTGGEDNEGQTKSPDAGG